MLKWLYWTTSIVFLGINSQWHQDYKSNWFLIKFRHFCLLNCGQIKKVYFEVSVWTCNNCWSYEKDVKSEPLRHFCEKTCSRSKEHKNVSLSWLTTKPPKAREIRFGNRFFLHLDWLWTLRVIAFLVFILTRTWLWKFAVKRY